MKEEVILGIDPGSRATGYGVISRIGNRLRYIDTGVIRPDRKLNFPGRLDRLYNGVREVIGRHQPAVSGVETIFQSVNVRSALILGHARGAAMLAAIHGGLEVFEYSPSEIKQAVAGYGRADKSQVQHMVCILLNLTFRPAADAADALAVAICHANSSGMNTIISSGAASRSSGPVSGGPLKYQKKPAGGRSR
ncbi:MAG TPA: crossover junction endodeoxyribonuclease RuvC [Thermodesulfobacteriaceae bacterium]|nr:crossover junction endodeoxyribonuclease RuvC [Thermodesulfobacteriaceae bacterium]